MKWFLLLALAVFLFSVQTQAVEFKSRIVEVVDGDSLTAVWSGRRVEVRLWGVDAPEWNQPFGRDASGKRGNEHGLVQMPRTYRPVNQV